MTRRQKPGPIITADVSASILKGFRERSPVEPAPQDLPEHAEPAPESRAEVHTSPAVIDQEPAPEMPVVHPDPDGGEFEVDEHDQPDEGNEDAPPKRARRPNRTRRLASRPALSEYSRVDGRTLRRSDRLPLATRISPEAHDTVRRLADVHGYSIADLIEQGIEEIAKKLDRRKKPS